MGHLISNLKFYISTPLPPLLISDKSLSTRELWNSPPPAEKCDPTPPRLYLVYLKERDIDL